MHSTVSNQKISQIAAEMWRNTTLEEKEPYLVYADKLHQDHNDLKRHLIAEERRSRAQTTYSQSTQDSYIPDQQQWIHRSSLPFLMSQDLAFTNQQTSNQQQVEIVTPQQDQFTSSQQDQFLNDPVSYLDHLFNMPASEFAQTPQSTPTQQYQSPYASPFTTPFGSPLGSKRNSLTLNTSMIVNQKSEIDLLSASFSKLNSAAPHEFLPFTSGWTPTSAVFKANLKSPRF
jgi:hypothetical protein